MPKLKTIVNLSNSRKRKKTKYSTTDNNFSKKNKKNQFKGKKNRKK